MRRTILSIFLALALCTLGGSAFAQTAQVSGQVTDPQKAAIANANIRIVDQATGIENRIKTNNAGYFVAPFLQPSHYKVFVQAPGFDTTVSNELILTVGQALALSFQMRVGVIQQQVTVDAGSQLLNTTDASVGTVIDRKFVENIPLNGRSFQDLISMTPGVVTQSPQSISALGSNGDFSVNGQRTESNYYTVDGVTANTSAGSGSGGNGPGTSGSLAGATALGTTQNLLSVDALQEFRVQGSTYSAEYGRSPGGQFSLVTRSGSKQFHGTAFDYLRNNFFDANDWFNDEYGKPTPALRQNDFGGTLGGPIPTFRLYPDKNRTFFFVSYEGLRLIQPQAASIQYVPDTFMRQQAPTALQAILNAYPVQNGTDYGNATNPSLAQFITTYSLPSRINSTGIRIDHVFSPKLSMFFRYADTPSSAASRTDFALAETQVGATTYTLGATSQFSNKLSNEFRLGYDQANSKYDATLDSVGGAIPANLSSGIVAGSAAQSSFIDLRITGIGLAYLGTQESKNLGRQWNLIDTFGILSGHHHLKLGIDYRRIKSPTVPPDPAVSAYFFSANSVLHNSANDLLLQRSISTTPIFNETAAFAQDEWQISNNLSLSLGLRWELNPPPTEAHGNDAYTLLGSLSNPASLTVAPQGTPLWKTSWLNFAPRLGLAWTAHASPGWETVVHTGAGVFFDTGNQLAADAYYGLGFGAYKYLYGAPLPTTSGQLDFLPSVTPPYTSSTIYAFPSHLQLPYTLEWNLSIEQALGHPQTFTLSYVGSNGRRLTGTQEADLGSQNPNFGYVIYFPNGITSDYQALQVKFQRSVGHGVQALASYTWSHSIDFGSNGSAIQLTRGNSDFDVRSNFQGGLSWDLPVVHSEQILNILSRGWGLDGRIITRTAFPIPLFGNFIIDPATGNEFQGNVDIVPGQPYYLYGSEYPGGRTINPQAFVLPTSATDPGNAPRNIVRGFGEEQVNVAARREFQLPDKFALQFRAETFNVFNHPNFGYVDTNRTDLTFGQATKMLNQSLGTMASQYQQGGPRSMQFALKLLF